MMCETSSPACLDEAPASPGRRALVAGVAVGLAAPLLTTPLAAAPVSLSRRDRFGGPIVPPFDNLRPTRPKAKMQGDDKDDKNTARLDGWRDPSDAACRRLLARLGWGARPDDLERFGAGGDDMATRIEAWLDAALGAHAADDAIADDAIADDAIADDATARVDAVLATLGLDAARALDLRILTRRAHTQRPLVERLVAFLHEFVGAIAPTPSAAALAVRDRRLRAARSGPARALLAAELPSARVDDALAALPRRFVAHVAGEASTALVSAAEHGLGASGRFDDMVRAVVRHPAFAAVGSAPLPPLDAAIGALRLFEVDVPRLLESAPDALVAHLEHLGQPVLADASTPLRAERPRAWSTTRARAAAWTFGAWLTTVVDTAGDRLVDSAAVLDGPPSAGLVVDGWARRLLGDVVAPDARRALLALAASGDRDARAAVVSALWTSPALHTR